MTVANLIWKEPVAVASTTNVAGLFVDTLSGPNDTLTASSNAVLTIDTYTVQLGDRVLLKNQTAGLQNGVYFTTQLNISGQIGTTAIATVGNIVQPSGTLTPGTYTLVSLTGGHGTGAQATIVVGTIEEGGSYPKPPTPVNLVVGIEITTAGTGYLAGDVLGFTGAGLGTGGLVEVMTTSSVSGLGAIVQPTGGTIKNGTYFTKLTGGTGSGAIGLVQVSSNTVQYIAIAQPGLGYSTGDSLSYNANGQGYGNSGTVTVGTVTVWPEAGNSGAILSFSSFTQPTTVLTTDGTYGLFPLTGGSGIGAVGTITISGGVVTSVVITNRGVGYASGDTLGFSGTINTPTQGLGTGGTVAVSTVSYTPWQLARTNDANIGFEVEAMAAFVSNGSQAETAWVQNTLSVIMDTTALTYVELVS